MKALPFRLPGRSLTPRVPLAVIFLAVMFLAVMFLAACMGPTVPVLNDDDAQAVMRVQSYLDGLRRFTARVTQTGTDGYATGYVWLERPGLLRVDYVQPRPKLVLARHGHLLLADRLTGTTTTLPVSSTPLDILLADHITLSGTVRVASVQRQPDAVQISLVKTAAPTQGMLTLQFSEHPMVLRGVVVQDRTGRSNTLMLSELLAGADINPSRFSYRPDQPPAGPGY